jgi:hypothetical protein
MADIPFLIAGCALFLGVNLIFSLHSIGEGHVGIYYRVSICSFTVLLFVKHHHMYLVSLLIFIYVSLLKEVQQGNFLFVCYREEHCYRIQVSLGTT